MHLPQSVLPRDGEGGGEASFADSELAALPAVEAEVSDVDADDADAAAAGVLEAAGSSELADAELSVAGVSGGLDSPPPHASQASGPEASRTNAVIGRRCAVLMLHAYRAHGVNQSTKCLEQPFVERIG